MDLLTTRREPGFDRFDALLLAAYAVLLAFAIHHYLPFEDEAQAWLVARDSTLRELLFRRLHYEGWPALWPLILWVMARLHLPYAAINWLSGALALPGIYLLLRYAPFPRLFRWLMPFTYFLQYQYAAVARPYVLAPGLIFALCILFRRQHPRPVAFALVAGVLANVSLHAAIVACIFCLLYLYELYGTGGDSGERVAIPTMTNAAVVFLLLALCAAAAAFPAPDAVISARPNQTVVKPHPWLERLIPEERLPPTAPPLDAPLETTGVDAKTLAQANARASVYPAIVRFAVKAVVLTASAACYPIAQSNLLAVSFLGCMAFWLWARGSPRLMLPFWIAAALSVHIFVYDHHTGIFLLALIAAAWISLDIPGGDQLASLRLNWMQPVFASVALLVIVLQIGWSYHCICSEVYAASDPGRATEQFLAGHFAGKKLAGFGFESTSVQAYASHNLFSNQPHAYWVWSVNTLTNRRRTEALREQPDAVVVADVVNDREVVYNQWFPIIPVGSRPDAQMMDFWESHGFGETHRFCGSQFRRMGVSHTTCEVVLEPAITSLPKW